MNANDIIFDSVEVPMPLPIQTSNGDDYPIREIVIYYKNKAGELYAKPLFSIKDIERHLGYGSHGWTQFRDESNLIKLKKMNFSDAKTILDALESKLLPRVQKARTKQNESFSYELSYFLKIQLTEETECKIISLEETKALLKTLNPNEIKQPLRHIKRVNKKDSEKDSETVKLESVSLETKDKDISTRVCTSETNNAALDIPSNFSWSFVFDNAKEITRYQEISNEEIALTQSIAESKKKLEMIQMQMCELQSEIEQKEEQSKQNRLLLLDFRLSLQNNPLLKNLFEGQKETNSANIDELNEKIDRLEKENQSLKDKAGEGENFRTAERFPDKKRFFLHDNKETNQVIGHALSKMARAKGIIITKIWNGSRDVGNYPIYLHNVLTKWIEAKTNNDFTAVLQEHLRPEYRAQ